MILRWADYPGLCGWAQCNPKGFFFFLNIYLSIYLFILPALGLSCSMWDLFFLVVACRLLVVECKLLVAVCKLLVVACMQDLVPRPGIGPRPLHWECGVSPAGPPGKSPKGSLGRGRQKSQNRELASWERLDNHCWLWRWKGAMSQGMQAASKSWKRQGNGFSPSVSRRNTALLTTWF